MNMKFFKITLTAVSVVGFGFACYKFGVHSRRPCPPTEDLRSRLIYRVGELAIRAIPVISGEKQFHEIISDWSDELKSCYDFKTTDHGFVITENPLCVDNVFGDNSGGRWVFEINRGVYFVPESPQAEQ